VTLAINQLEASLGVRLFQRTTRKVSLTAEGEAFLVRVAGILGGVDEAVTMFGAPGDIVRGVSGSIFLPPWRWNPSRIH
jgi:LysR family transcriptional regulator, regulator for bpeEF and oprC